MSVKLLLAGRYAGGEHFFTPPEAPGLWLKRLERWVREHAPGPLESTRLTVGPQDAPMLLVRLHPAAGEVSLLAAGGGRVVVSADTSAVGPGYHLFLCDALKHLGEA